MLCTINPHSTSITDNDSSTKVSFKSKMLKSIDNSNSTTRTKTSSIIETTISFSNGLNLISSVQNIMNDIILNACEYDFKTYDNLKSIKIHPSFSFGDNILGILQTSEYDRRSLSILLSSSSIPFLFHVLFQIKSIRTSCVFHISSSDFNNEGLFYKSNSQNNLIICKDLDIPIILSSNNNQEIYDMTILSTILSLLNRSSIFHWFDGIYNSENSSKCICFNDNYIKSLIDYCSNISSISSNSIENIQNAFNLLNDSILNIKSSKRNQSYDFFEYYGSKNASNIIVCLNSSINNETDYNNNDDDDKQNIQFSIEKLKLILMNNNISKDNSFGLIIVRVYRPWYGEKFKSFISKETKQIYVINSPNNSSSSSSSSLLLNDINSTLYSTSLSISSIPKVSLIDINFLEKSILANVLQQYYSTIGKNTITTNADIDIICELYNFTSSSINNTSDDINYLFNDNNNLIGDLFNIDEIQLIKQLNSYRCTFENNTNSIEKLTLINQSKSIKSKETKLTFCKASPTCLMYDDILNNTKTNGFFCIIDYSLCKKISKNVLDIIENKSITILLIESSSTISDIIYDLYSISNNEFLEKWNNNNTIKDEWLNNIITEDLSYPIDFSSTFKKNGSSIVSSNINSKILSTTNIKTNLYWRFTFPEFFNTKEIIWNDKISYKPQNIFQLKITKWLRLTPESYERNIFHIEMDITNTGLKYQIGDALGVYGFNDPDDVKNFMKEFNLNPNELISFSNNNNTNNTNDSNYNTSIISIRTIEQVLIQEIDLFGKPTKKFYKNLSIYSTNEDVKQKLFDIGSNEGSDEFKKRLSESITMADIIIEFSKFLKLSIYDIISLVGLIKPRHYSIASSMNLNPNSVHLLVVDHTWITPSGKMKYGQCTRYLKNLNNGDKVKVSVKPSIMRLPESTKTPIIMAGLGTGMAPFRAFIQERLYQKQQGKEIGEIALYFGSRSSKQEYLYGEELEYYLSCGILTKLGLAFSRDQKHKIYIQHRIKDDSNMIYNLLNEKQGHFYLCGPTWPVGDVKDAILYSFENNGNMSKEKAEKELLNMKLKERYTLEVY